MKKRTFLTSLVLTVLIFSMALPLVGCAKGQPPELEPIKDRLIYLIECSKELNLLFFGKGLPVYRREALLSDRRLVYQKDTMRGYDYLSEHAAYQTVDELRKRAEPIYTTAYFSEISETAFDGVLVGNTGAYLRFYEAEGVLYQNTDATDFGLSERIYDYSTMKLHASSVEDYITVAIESYTLENAIRITVFVSFAYERGNWYLDSATY